ncbi:protein of unknown function [Candidatus Nitrospira inopinata]|uniref:Uncharacterized protein n=1 Tax=Candidatus Nitrospira inopinata TaxID=1715989 RepID=A0A0S4KSV9_9BACT|nr:protein of unknown function [Candidatus Nitrospira inopinata]
MTESDLKPSRGGADLVKPVAASDTRPSMLTAGQNPSLRKVRGCESPTAKRVLAAGNLHPLQ